MRNTKSRISSAYLSLDLQSFYRKPNSGDKGKQVNYQMEYVMKMGLQNNSQESSSSAEEEEEEK